MSISFLDACTALLAVVTGFLGGFFFAFSVVVMRALGSQPPAHAVAAMQAINVVVINPWFVIPFLGAAVGSVALAIAVLIAGSEEAGVVVAGCALYAIGTFGVTMAFNVPRNQALEALPAQSAEAAELWKRYLVEWTRWNHVRTISALLAAACLGLARCVVD